MSSAPKSCRYCGERFSDGEIYLTTAVCGKCGLTTEFPKRNYTPWLVIIASLLILGTLAYTQRIEILYAFNPALAAPRMSEPQLKGLLKRCTREEDSECVIAAYRRLAELDPNNIYYQANLAFELTKAKRFKDADPHYQKVLAAGFGTFDLFAYYGTNWEGLGDTKNAITWYRRSLDIDPNLVDVTRKLGAAYVKTGRADEAVRLLRSFIERNPEAKGYVMGDLTAIKASR